MKKIMGMILGTLLISNVSITTYGATSNLDKLYTTAFQSVEICKKSYTQQSVNNARVAINDLQDTEASWAIGEFSKQVDVVQNELFSTFMDYLFSYDYQRIPKQYVPQSDVNRAKDLVLDFDLYPGNKPYIASWSSTVDKYQQMLIVDIVKLVENAENTEKSIDVDSAKVGISSLLTAKNNKDVIEFANKLLERVNEIKGDGSAGDVAEGDI